MRNFLCTLALTILVVGCDKNVAPITLTILHTNDTHSQVEPRETDDCGGYARRMGVIKQEREKDPELLLLDAGDFCQGTPYFNIYKGEVEVDAMNYIGYDAATIGNHEFDNGVEALAKTLKRANFPIVCANYKTEGTPLEGVLKPYTIIYRKGLKIGVIGVGVNPEALVAPDNFAPLVWEHPFPIVNELADNLKNKEHCDVIIVLSHLGTGTSHGDSSYICDVTLAEQSKYIDVIIGGHTHRVENEYVKNQNGQDVLVVQTGKSGVNLGKITLNVN